MADARDFKDILQEDNDLSKMLDELNVDNPTSNIIPEQATTFELLQWQAELANKTMNEALKLMMLGEGEPPSRESITDLMERNALATRMLQQRHQEKSNKAKGSYFNHKRKPICEIPEIIKNGKQNAISDSALKLIHQFSGDGNNEQDNLRTFLRNLFDVSRTNGLTEECTKTVLKRKLTGTARILIDAYELELNDPNRPTLLEVVLKLEDRYLSDLRPELANARLSALKKTDEITYQKLEGQINELVYLAARGQKGDTTEWSATRKIEVFKSALNETDRGLIYQENQSRNIANLPDLTLSQAVDYLIKINSEKNAFTQATEVKAKEQETDSVFRTRDNENYNQTNKPQQGKKGKRAIKKAQEDEKIKEELFQMYENRKQQGYNRNRGKGNQFRYKNNGQQTFTRNQQGQNTRNKNQYKPRVFVTPQQVNVDPYGCLKCNSTDHRFQEIHKCVYGNSNLMSRPCFNCKVGGHHTQVCIKSKNSTVGAPPTSNQQQQEPVFSRWPENREVNKAIQEAPEARSYSLFPTSKNEKLPSVFPYQ